jgi:hypothetical protein
MYRGMSARARKLTIGAATATLMGAALAVGTGIGQAGEDCGGLDTALRNNLNFIAGQRANPDAQSAARIANRDAVVALIQRRRAAAGCTGGQGQSGQQDQPDQQDLPGQPGQQDQPGQPGGQPPAAGGDVVCAGQNVTLFNEDAGPAASSGTLPIGTRIKVTNGANDKSVTVQVTSTSGTCVLLNNAAFEQVREPGKNVIRQATVERVG